VQKYFQFVMNALLLFVAFPEWLASHWACLAAHHVDHQTNSITYSHGRIFGFIARKERNYRDNVCHLFAENSAERPASIIVSAIKDLMSQSTGE